MPYMYCNNFSKKCHTTSFNAEREYINPPASLSETSQAISTPNTPVTTQAVYTSNAPVTTQAVTSSLSPIYTCILPSPNTISLNLTATAADPIQVRSNDYVRIATSGFSNKMINPSLLDVYIGNQACSSVQLCKPLCTLCGENNPCDEGSLCVHITGFDGMPPFCVPKCEDTINSADCACGG